MNDFNPGDGWREITYQESVNGRRYLREHGDDGVPTHTWVHEEPVPPLPTEPGYYVDADGCAWRLDADGDWDDTFGNPTTPGSADPKPPLERYEPRRETAKAIEQRLRDLGMAEAADEVNRV